MRRSVSESWILLDNLSENYGIHLLLFSVQKIHGTTAHRQDSLFPDHVNPRGFEVKVLTNHSSYVLHIVLSTLHRYFPPRSTILSLKVLVVGTSNIFVHASCEFFKNLLVDFIVCRLNSSLRG
jgi:hypothetical protein